MSRLTAEVIAWLRTQPPRVQYAILSRLRGRTEPGTDWPAITEQVWAANPYLAKWGGWNVPQAAFGKEWGAYGEGPGHLNGPILVAPYGQGMHVGQTLDNCRVLGLGPTPTNKWAIRSYNQISPVRRKCEFLGHLPEHYLYESILQGGLFEDLRFGQLGAKNAQAAAVQVALRNIFDVGSGIDYSYETQNPELALVETTRVYRRCRALHLGDPASERWGAFIFSEHAPQLQVGGLPVAVLGTHVRFEDCEIVSSNLSWTDGNGKLVNSPRGVLVQGRASAVLWRFKIDNLNPFSGWAARLNNNPHVEIGKCEVRDGVVEVTDPKTLSVWGNTGGAKLRVIVKGAQVYEGALSHDFEL